MNACYTDSVMKKSFKLLSLAALFALAAPALIYAQNDQAVPGGPGMPPPPPNAISAPSNSSPQSAPGGLQGRLQAQYQTDMANLQNNRDYRNGVMARRSGSSTPVGASSTLPFHGRPHATSTPMFGGPGTMVPRRDFGSTTRPWQEGNNEGSTTMSRPGFLSPGMPHGMMPPLYRRFASSTMFASSSLIQKLTADHQQQRDIRADAFAFIQGNLVQQLDQSLANLQQIQTRIASRIQTETAQGVDMTKADTLMDTASSGISLARLAIQAVSAYMPSASSTDLTATTTVDLSQARELGTAAIASVNAVRQALDQAIQAISQGIGAPPAGTSTEQTPPIPPVPASNQ